MKPTEHIFAFTTDELRKELNLLKNYQFEHQKNIIFDKIKDIKETILEQEKYFKIWNTDEDKNG